MKRIAIVNNSGEIVLYDKNNSDLSTYALEISEIMKEKDVTILETTSGSVVLKPSQISCIYITEVSDNQCPANIESSDVITDGDE
jgi:hypothetical protein